MRRSDGSQHIWRLMVLASLPFATNTAIADESNGPIFKQPYISCETQQAPLPPICTYVDVGGATVAGHAYPPALCDDVRHVGRPFHPIPVPHRTNAADPRLKSAFFRQELAWVTAQAKATACACCHDSATDHHAAMWDIAADAIWTDQLSRRAVAMMAGRFDSSVFGNVPPSVNNGFDRSRTGIPTTDIQRMQAFFDQELTRRGITQTEIDHMPPFGVPGKVGRQYLGPFK